MLIIADTISFETVTTKKSDSGGNDRFAFGVSEMQGWRVGAYFIAEPQNPPVSPGLPDSRSPLLPLMLVWPDRPFRHNLDATHHITSVPL